ncbi:MAG TPA: hypothetical protein VGI81_12875 [Tepidisphaeraceae bacterium]|jgi:hypothetical protein
MVVEHTFVTTMEAPQTMSAAAQFLQEFGFVADGQRAFALGGTWDALEVRRGRARRGKRYAIRDWPQQVRLEWDRGRVDVAASATPPPTGNFDTRWGDKLRKDESASVQELLFTVARSLELLLGARQPDQARAELQAIDRRLIERADRNRRRVRFWIILLLVFVALAVGLLVWSIVANAPHR